MTGLTVGDAALFAAVALLGLHHTVMRSPWVLERAAVFWSLQILSLSTMIALFAVGVPGLDGALKIFNYVLGLLLMMRILQANKRLTAHRRERTQATSAREAEILAALEASRKE